MFWSGSAAAQSLVHSVRGTPSLCRGSPVAEMCSPAPNSVADAGMGEFTSMYWSCSCWSRPIRASLMTAKGHDLRRVSCALQMAPMPFPCLHL